MKNAMAVTAARTVGLAPLLVAVAVAVVLGATLLDTVEATKNSKNTIASVRKRIAIQVDVCETIGGGTLTVERVPKGKGAHVTHCDGGANDGQRCVHGRKATVCNPARTQPPPSNDVSGPVGGGSADPGANTGGGSSHAGGGTAAPPGGEANPDGGESEQPPIL